MDYSLSVSQIFFEKLKKRLENESNNLTCIYSTFNSGKERGLMLIIHGNDNYNENELFIWSGSSWDTERIMVVVANDCSNKCDVYNDKDYKLARYFDIGDYDKAVTYAYNVIKKKFQKVLRKNTILHLECIRVLKNCKRLKRILKI